MKIQLPASVMARPMTTMPPSGRLKLLLPLWSSDSFPFVDIFGTCTLTRTIAHGWKYACDCVLSHGRKVRAIVYSLHGLPGSLLSGLFWILAVTCLAFGTRPIRPGVETSTAKCKLVLKGESAEGCTDFVPLQQEKPLVASVFCGAARVTAVRNHC